MCDFFSFVTEPEKNGGKRFYFDWKYRSDNLQDNNHDSHSSICKHFGLSEDACNKYEFNPLTKVLEVDQINSEIDDRLQAEDWVNNVNFKRIIEPLVIKPIVNPFDLLKVKTVTKEHIELLKQWSSVWDSVMDSVWNSVMDSVRDSVRAYISSFFDIKYRYDFSLCTKLWESGLVPSFDGKTWRLHSGKNADVVYEWMPDNQGTDSTPEGGDE